MDIYRKCIAENIQTLRQAHSLTQAELAEQLSYTDKAVSKWERGESVPDVFTLKAISELFGVTVDYLFYPHSVDEVRPQKHIKSNHIIITLMSVAFVWFIATFVFVVGKTWLPNVSRLWLAYVVAVPVSIIIILIFNSIWGRSRYNYLIISLLCWTSIAAVYISFFSYNYWLLFFIGIPGQIIIILWSRLKKRK